MATISVGPNFHVGGESSHFDDLQSAMNAASYGDTLILDHTKTFSQGASFIAPVPKGNSANGYAVIQSDALASLPQPDPNQINLVNPSLPQPSQPWNGRVSPSHSTFMPKVGISSALYFQNFSILTFDLSNGTSQPNKWRFRGIEFALTDQNAATQNGGLWCGVALITYDRPLGAAEPARDISNAVGPLWFDQCYIHGWDNQMSNDGLHGEANTYIALTNCYIANIRGSHGAQNQNPEAHGISYQGGPGPLVIINNYIEATGQSLICGGGGQWFVSDQPAGFLYYNTFAKNPAWWGQKPPFGDYWLVKNLTEWKTGVNWIVDHNLYAYTWTAAQGGGGILCNLAQYGSENPMNFANFTITNNVMYRVQVPFGFARNFENAPLANNQLPQNTLMENNLLVDVGWYNADPLSGQPTASGQNYLQDSLGITWNHNTSVAAAGTILHNIFDADPASGLANACANTVMINNIWQHGAYGYQARAANGGTASDDLTQLDTDLGIGVSGSKSQVANNVVYGPKVLSPPDPVPSDLAFASDVSHVGFDSTSLSITYQAINGTNLTIPLYQLAASSPYKNKGTDGRDPGVDVTKLPFQNSGGLTATKTAVTAATVAFGTATTAQVTVTSSSGAGTPTGTVTVTTDSGAITQTGNLSAGTQGTATGSISMGNLTVGTHTLVATYGGDSSFAGSTGQGLAVVTGGPNKRKVTDSPGIAEILHTSVLRRRLWPILILDFVGIAELITDLWIHTGIRRVFIREGLGIADLITVKQITGTVIDSIGIADVITVSSLHIGAPRILIQEAIGIADQITTQRTARIWVVPILDAIGIADSELVSTSKPIDSIGIADIVSVLRSNTVRVITDGIGISDSAIPLLPPVAILQARWRVDTPIGRWSVPAGSLGQDWWIAQGEDKQILFLPDGMTPDVTNWTMRWQLRQGDGNFPPVITADTSNGTIIIIDGINGVIQLDLVRAMTQNLILQTAPWYWELVRYGIRTEVTLARGTLTIATPNVQAIPGPPPAQTYNRLVPEALGVRDVATAIKQPLPLMDLVTIPDALALSDLAIVIILGRRSATLGDNLGLAEQITTKVPPPPISFFRVVADAVGSADVVLARSSVRKVILSDALGVADVASVQTQRLAGRLIADGIGVGELFNLSPAFTRPIVLSDGVAIAESVTSRTSRHLLLLSDAIGVADTPSVSTARARSLALTDNIGVADNASAHTLMRLLALSDSIGLKDTVAAAVARLFHIVQPDALGLADTPHLATRSTRTVKLVDAAGVADKVQLNRPIHRLVVIADALGIAEKETTAMIGGSSPGTPSTVQLKFSKTTPMDPYLGAALAGMAQEAGLIIDPATTPSDTTITVSYQITNAVSASLVVTGGGSQSLITDGQQHTTTYQPTVSGLARVLATDAGGNSFIQPLHHIVRETLPALDPNGAPTFTSAQSGDWATAATWTQNAVPGRDAIVKIQSGHSITSSGRANQCGRLIISNGTLTHTNGVFHVTDVDVPAGGNLVIGDGATTSMFMLHNRPQHANDTANFWRAVYIEGGTLVVRGPTRQNTFVRLAVEPKAGDTQLTLTTPVSQAGGWKIGYTIVIPDTTMHGLYDVPNGSIAISNVTFPVDGPSVCTTTAAHPFHVGDRVQLYGPSGPGEDMWGPVFGNYIVGSASFSATTFSLLHTWGRGAPTLTQQGTAQLEFQDRTETAIIRGLSADGLTVYLNEPLQYAHPGMHDASGTLNPAMMPHVANLLAVAGFLTSDPTDQPTRAHFRATGRSTIDCYAATWHGLGRFFKGKQTATNPDNTNCYLDNLLGPVGGLPVRDGTFPYASYQFRLDSCVFMDPHPVRHYSKAKWGLAFDSSYYGYIGNNIAYNWAGASFMMVSGSEVYNVVENNYAILSCGTVGRGVDSAPGDPGAGFYMTSPLNYFRGNVAAVTWLGSLPGFIGYGYNYIAPDAATNAGLVKIPSSQGQDPSNNTPVAICRYPLLQFANCEAYSTLGGMEYYQLGETTSYEGMPFSEPYSPNGESILLNFKAWNFMNAALFPYPASLLTIQNLLAWNDFGVLARNVAYSSGLAPIDYHQDRRLVDNADIRGCYIGYGATSLVGFTNDKQSLTNSFLQNQINVLMRWPWNSGYWPRPAIGRQSIFYNNMMVAPPGRPLISFSIYDDNLSNPGVAGLSIQDFIFVYAHQRNPNDNFQIYWNNCAPATVMPQTTTQVIGNSTFLITLAAPSAGQTNQFWSNPANDPTGHGKIYNYANMLTPANGIARADISGFTGLPILCGQPGNEIPLPYPGNGVR